MYKITNDADALNHLRASGAKNLRLPGGNVSNSWLWDDQSHWTYHEDYLNKVVSGPTKPNNLNSVEQIAIADSIGAMPQPCVNLALARYIQGSDSVQQAASYAADWVRQLNITEQRKVKYWEVGNENYGSWVNGYEVNGVKMTGTMYGQMFKVFADSMHAVDPTIKIGAVVYEGETNNWTGTWNQEVLPLVQDHADYLVVHQYFTYSADYNDVTVTEVIDALPDIVETKELLEDHVDAYTSKAKDHFPIAMTEYNVRAGRKNSQQISAVFNAMAVGEYIRSGYGLVNIWDVANAFSGGEDHGMLTRNDPGRTNYQPNPTFYTYFMTNNVFGDHLVNVTPESANNVRVYPTLFSEGEAGVLVVNSGNTTQHISLNLNNFEHDSTYKSFHLTASGPESREVLLNDQSESAVSGPLNYATIAPFETSFTGSPTLTLEPYSVNTYYFNKKEDVVNTQAIKLMSHLELSKIKDATIYDLNGKAIDFKNSSSLAPGIRIIRLNNGTTQTVIQK